MSIIIEEIDLNGVVHKVIKKTYQMLDGTSHSVTNVQTINHNNSWVRILQGINSKLINLKLLRIEKLLMEKQFF